MTRPSSSHKKVRKSNQPRNDNFGLSSSRTASERSGIQIASGSTEISSLGSRIREGGAQLIDVINEVNPTTAAAVAQFPRKLEIGTLVWAKDPLRGLWRRAKVMSLIRPMDYPISLAAEQAMLPANADELALRRLGLHEAYVHWVSSDRRLDCWVKFEDICSISAGPPASEHDWVLWDDPEDDSSQLHAGLDAEYLKEHEESTRIRTIEQIVLGDHLIDTWYFAPYPREVQNTNTLYICEFCLAYFKYGQEMVRHRSRCTGAHPPGDELYRDGKHELSMWEVDGGIARIYCENLCFISKLFLDHKTLRHPVHLFLFYILCEIRSDGHHIVGYFSKEKYSRNNLSCILTLPQHQKKGYGKFLINFSYALSLKEGKRGTPERPLSDLGRASYLNFWIEVLLPYLKSSKSITIEGLASQTSFEPADILMCLEHHKLIHFDENTREPVILLPEAKIKVMEIAHSKPPIPIEIAKLRWIPYDAFLASFEYNSNV